MCGPQLHSIALTLTVASETRFPFTGVDPIADLVSPRTVTSLSTPWMCDGSMHAYPTRRDDAVLPRHYRAQAERGGAQASEQAARKHPLESLTEVCAQSVARRTLRRFPEPVGTQSTGSTAKPYASERGHSNKPVRVSADVGRSRAGEDLTAPRHWIAGSVK
jgi:hypothetical protein